MADIAALAAHLDAEPRYDAALQAGENAELMRLLNEERPGGTIYWLDCDRDPFVNAVSLANLNAQREARIQTYLTGDRPVAPTSQPNVRTWLESNLSVPALAALAAAVERTSTWAQQAGAVAPGLAVQLPHVRAAVRRIARSYIVASGQAALET